MADFKIRNSLEPILWGAGSEILGAGDHYACYGMAMFAEFNKGSALNKAGGTSQGFGKLGYKILKESEHAWATHART